MTTTIEFITALFCQIDDQLAGLPKRLYRAVYLHTADKYYRRTR